MAISTDEVIRVLASTRTDLNRDALMLAGVGSAAAHNLLPGGANMIAAGELLEQAKDRLNAAIVEMGGRP